MRYITKTLIIVIFSGLLGCSTIYSKTSGDKWGEPMSGTKAVSTGYSFGYALMAAMVVPPAALVTIPIALADAIATPVADFVLLPIDIPLEMLGNTPEMRKIESKKQKGKADKKKKQRLN